MAEQSKQPVDVLESLAAWANEKDVGMAEWRRRATIVDAVAELVEVHAALLAEYGPNICSMRVDAPRRALWLRASAALARVQGGAP